MRRLIDANALKVKGFADPETGEGIIYVQDIDEAPTVDAVEVVRCKDCEKWLADITSYTFVDGKLHPMGCCQHTHRYTADCDFCSYGERKDND